MTKKEKDAIIELLKSGNHDMFVTAAHLIMALYKGNIDPESMETVEQYLYGISEVSWTFFDPKDAKKFYNFLLKLGIPATRSQTQSLYTALHKSIYDSVFIFAK